MLRLWLRPMDTGTSAVAIGVGISVAAGGGSAGLARSTPRARADAATIRERPVLGAELTQGEHRGMTEFEPIADVGDRLCSDRVV